MVLHEQDRGPVRAATAAPDERVGEVHPVGDVDTRPPGAKALRLIAAAVANRLAPAMRVTGPSCSREIALVPRPCPWPMTPGPPRMTIRAASQVTEGSSTVASGISPGRWGPRGGSDPRCLPRGTAGERVGEVLPVCDVGDRLGTGREVTQCDLLSGGEAVGSGEPDHELFDPVGRR